MKHFSLKEYLKNPCKFPNGHVVCLLKREYYKKYGFFD